MKLLLRFAFVNIKNSMLTVGLNLMGLISAFTALILIVLYVWNEYHFDTYNENADNIYRIEVKYSDNDKTSVYLFGPTGETMKQEFPEIIASTTYMPWGKWEEGAFNWENRQGKIKEFSDYAYSDENLTEIFSFNIIKGKKQFPLHEPQSVIVSESFARKAWGEVDPIGKSLVTGGTNYYVSAVFSDLPKNSVITCPVILKLPTEGWLAESAKGWSVTNFPQFVLVRPGTNAEQLSKKINSQSVVKEKHNQYLNKGKSVELVARSLCDLRFTNEVAETPIFSANNKVFVDSLLLVGILIFLIALINYINFATATIPKRLKSVSITRIIGSGKAEIIITFLTETFILFAASFLTAVFIAYALNKGFSTAILGYRLPFENNLNLVAVTGILSVGFGLLAGIYPAIYSTSGKPVELLKKQKNNSKINFRGILTVSQFVATITLIIASITVIKQVQYMKGAELGFSKDQTLIIKLNNDIKKNIDVFINRLKESPFVDEYAFSRAVPGQAQESATFRVNGEQCTAWYWAADANYLKMMKFQLLEGRLFMSDSQAETGNIVCNETAAKRYGWVIGQKIADGTLVGIIKDFNFVSLRESVDPFIFWNSSTMDPFQCVSIKLNPGGVSDALQSIKEIYDEVSPAVPFRYFFMDEHMDELYSKENQQVRLISAFSFLSVIVSILGILGLSIFMCQYKIKEIGIRKVTGARVHEILAMLNKDFMKWVVIAFLVAVPVSWFVMNKWLGNFAYKTELSWWVFALAGLLAMGIALLTVSFQSYNAAIKNPVESLRYE